MPEQAHKYKKVEIPIPVIPPKVLLLIGIALVAGTIITLVAVSYQSTSITTTIIGSEPPVPQVPSMPNPIPNYVPLKVGQHSITALCKEEEVPKGTNAKKIFLCETPDLDLGNFPKEIKIGDFIFSDFREKKTKEKILIVGIYKRGTATTVEGGYRGLNIERVALDEEKKRIRVGVGINITSREPGKNILTGQVGDIVISYYPSEVTINYPANKVIKYIRVRFIYIYI